MAKMHTPAMERIERKRARRKKPVKSTPAYESWKRFKRNPTAIIGLIVVILLILRIGNLMSLGWDRIYLLYNDMVMETADVISTYVYKIGVLQFNYSYSTAVGLFNSLVNLAMLLIVNTLSDRISKVSVL
jgi:putative aldouronate transport system permease protein